MYYAFRNNQGWLIALHDEIDKSIELISYDPWGNRRSAKDWTVSDTLQNHIVDRGYTFHEHLDEFGLINMNGRMYDPHYATFLSPDPVLQSPDNWLNYNRYSYCFGNPLKYSDPSGLRGVRMTKGNNPNSQENTVGEYDDGYEHDTRCVYNPQTDTYDGGTFNAVEIIGQRQQTSMFNALFDQVCKAISKFQNGMDTSYDTGGYGKSACDYVSNGVGATSAMPTIPSTWKYNGNKLNNGASWTGKNGKFYRTSTTPKNNICYNNSMNMAKNASKVARTTGNCMTLVASAASIASACIDVSQGKDNTSTWVNLAVGVGTGVITFVAGPAVVTGAAVVGAVWGVSQLVVGDEINGWIDSNVGYR